MGEVVEFDVLPLPLQAVVVRVDPKNLPGTTAGEDSRFTSKTKLSAGPPGKAIECEKIEYEQDLDAARGRRSLGSISFFKDALVLQAQVGDDLSYGRSISCLCGRCIWYNSTGYCESMMKTTAPRTYTYIKAGESATWW